MPEVAYPHPKTVGLLAFSCAIALDRDHHFSIPLSFGSNSMFCTRLANLAKITNGDGPVARRCVERPECMIARWSPSKIIAQTS